KISMKKLIYILLLIPLLACQAKQERLLVEAREHWHDKEYRAAATCYEQFLQIQGSPQQLQARSELANTYYLNLRDYTRAEFHYRMLLLEVKDEAANAELTLAAHRRLAELSVKSGRLVQAIDEYEQLFLRAPEQERRELRLTVANLYYDRNDLD